MLEGIKKLHFVGIGGVGMSAIAEVMLDKGYEISGSDLSESAVVKHLKAKGATIYKGHDALNVEGKEALVLSSAIHQDNPELVAAKAKGLKLFHRSDILAYLLNFYSVQFINEIGGLYSQLRPCGSESAFYCVPSRFDI